MFVETDITADHLKSLGFYTENDVCYSLNLPAAYGLFGDLCLRVDESFDGGYVVSLAQDDTFVVLSSMPERLTVERLKALILVLAQPAQEGS